MKKWPLRKRWINALITGVCSAAIFAGPLVRVSQADDAPAPAPAAAPTATPGAAESTVGGSADLNEYDDATRARIDKALEWLARNINDDGSGKGGGGDMAAIMALAGIAFVADGNLPNNGRYGREVDHILNYILKNSQESGLITAQNGGSPMYGHGFATLFLSEVYGMSDRPEVKEKLQGAIRVIINSQNPEGGWRYQPIPQDADVSVTICEMMALRAARNGGVKVPHSTVTHAIDYIRKAQDPDGGFAYMLTSRGSGFPRSAAGVCSLQYAGMYGTPEIVRGIKYLTQRLPGSAENSADYHYFYGNYYCTQAMFMAGGSAWKAFWPAIKEDLKKRQETDGSWSDQVGALYGTSMALIIMQVPNRLLPILQK